MMRNFKCLMLFVTCYLLALSLSNGLLVTLVTPVYAQVDYSQYVWTEYAPKDPTTVPSDLKQKLENEVNKMMVDNNGDGKYDHLAPFTFSYGIEGNVIWPQDQYSGGGKSTGTPHQYFIDPGETIYTLSLAFPYLSPALQTKVRAFLTEEMANYTPLSFVIYGADKTSKYYNGVRRESYTVPPDLFYNIWPPVQPAIETLYAYWLYSKNTGDTAILANNWTAMVNLYTTYKNAYNGGWKPTYSEIGGLVGFARIAKQENQTTLSNEAANLAIQIMSTQGLNFNQMQQNTDAAIQPGTGWVTGVFANIQPEIGKYLNDNTATAASAFLNNLLTMKNLPLWYPAWSEIQGHPDGSAFPQGSEAFMYENTFNLPITAYSIFLGKTYTQAETQENLRKFLDIPWSLGDLYYLQKLIVTLEAPSSGIPTPTPGATATPTPTPSPTPPPKTGDINGDGSVNVVDFSIMLSKWNTSDPGADLNGDGIVNVVDFSLLLTNWGT